MSGRVWFTRLLMRLTLMAADLVSLALAMVTATALLDNTVSLEIIKGRLETHKVVLLCGLVLYPGLFHLFRLYRYAWRFASVETLWSVVCANTVGALALAIVQAAYDRSQALALSLLTLFWLLSIIIIGGVRIVLRLLNIRRHEGLRGSRRLANDLPPKRAIILGAGAHAARLLIALQDDPEHTYDVVGFLDDDPAKVNTYIRNVKVLGPLDRLHELLAGHALDEVLVAITRVGGARIRDYVLACRTQGVAVKIVPGLIAMLDGRAQLRLEEFSVEDLLRRQPVQMDLATVGGYLTGKRVLVTGGGGSIGSELCRQVSALGPAALYLLGHGEHSIHKLYTELVASHPELVDRYRMVIGSVADQVRIRQVMKQHKPEILFHTAAHKHVPIMEQNVLEAIKNNVLGTYYVAEACGLSGVERMVLISTDKAVYPSSIMGATKWLCEEIVRAAADSHPGTTYITVRFGNVLDSRGSVVPLFREQLKRGGPITVTHPEVTRYFMTIREAVQLVLQAAAVGDTGELFLLDMGQPVKILDLARDMIRLSGFEPDVDVPITFTGLRAGEKLYEQLISDDEEIEPAECEGLSIVHRRQYTEPSEVLKTVRQFEELVVAADEEGCADLLHHLIPSLARAEDRIMDEPFQRSRREKVRERV